MIDQIGEPAPSLTRLALVLARQWWPQLVALAAACGVVAMTIAGAACVGRSMETGLRNRALGRLGRIEAALVGETFFTIDLAERMRAGSAGGGPAAIVSAIVMPVTVSAGGSTAAATLLACNDPAGLGFEPVPPPLAPAGILVNSPLATTLGLVGGEAIVLRLPRRSAVPADSPLGRRTDDSDGRRLRVTTVLPSQGIGSFSLRPVQATGPLVVTSLEVAQAILRRGRVANVVFAAGNPATGEAAACALAVDLLAPFLEPAEPPESGLRRLLALWEPLLPPEPPAPPESFEVGRHIVFFSFKLQHGCGHGSLGWPWLRFSGKGSGSPRQLRNGSLALEGPWKS